VTALVTGVAGLRLAADAVLDLWRRDDGAPGERAAARRELSASAALVSGWYERLAAGLDGTDEVPEPPAAERLAGMPLFVALDRDLSDPDHRAGAVAVRMLWTADHLDAARRLATTLVGPARKVARFRMPARGEAPIGLRALRVLRLTGPAASAAAGGDALAAPSD